MTVRYKVYKVEEIKVNGGDTITALENVISLWSHDTEAEAIDWIATKGDEYTNYTIIANYRNDK